MGMTDVLDRAEKAEEALKRIEAKVDAARAELADLKARVDPILEFMEMMASSPMAQMFANSGA